MHWLKHASDEQMMEKRKKDIFSDRIIRRLWAPSMLTAVFLAMADMADAVVIGQRTGAAGLAAVSLALPVFMVINVFVHGFGIGGSAYYSKCIGQGQEKKAIASFNQIFILVLGVSVLLSVLGQILLIPLLRLLGTQKSDGAVFEACYAYVRIILLGFPVLFLSFLLNYYLRNDNNQNLAAFGFTAGNVTDLLCNVLLVLVLDQGAAGAAASTVLGQVVALLFYLPGLFWKRKLLRLEIRQMLAIDWKACGQRFRVGFSSSIEYLWQFLFFLIINRSLMYYTGENGVAVFDMVQNMSYLLFYLYEYTAKAMQPLLSTYYGEHQIEGIRYVRKKGILLGTSAGLVVTVLLFFFPSAVGRLFGLEGTELITMGNQAIRIFCLGGLAAGIGILLEGFYQSCEDEKPAYLLSTLRGTAVLIPTALLLLPFGMPWLWFYRPLTEYISLAIFFILRKRMKKEPFDPVRVYSRVLENREEELTALLEKTREFCEKWQADGKQRYLLNMAVEELCSLIMKRAFRGERKGFIQVTLVALPDQEFELHIRDDAAAFDPFSQDAQKLSVGSEDQTDLDTIGLLVIKEKAKSFFYHKYQNFNTLIVKI